MNGYLKLLAEIDKQKRLKSLTNSDIAKETGLALSTINGFMGGKRYSALAEKKIREFLKISKKFSA